MRPTMVMLIGPTGCGKSTFRQKQLAGLPCVSPDDYIVGKWSLKKAAHAWRHAHSMATELLAEKQSFVVDAQFLTSAVRRKWIASAQRGKFCVHAVLFNTSWKQIQKNQKARGSRGLYGKIPYAVQRHNYKLSQQFDITDIMDDGCDIADVVEFGSKDRIF